MASDTKTIFELPSDKPVTVLQLWQELGKLKDVHPNMTVTLMLGPSWDEAVLTTGLCAPQHGTVWLMGEVEENDSDLPRDWENSDNNEVPVDVAFAVLAEEVRKKQKNKAEEDFDPNIAESA